jgi:hypothetical protein
MDDRLVAIVEINEVAWARFQKDIASLDPDEAEWRPLPGANTVNLILRHLLTDASWHLASIEGEPGHVAPPPESLSLDPVQDLRDLAGLMERFLTALRGVDLPTLKERSARAYADYPPGSVPEHFLGYHFALHLTGHDAQIRTLRNLFRKARGETPLFFPDNPTFPREGAG